MYFYCQPIALFLIAHFFIQNRSTALNARNARIEPRDRASPWDDETRQMLVQNPETGSFYVPAGSGMLVEDVWLNHFKTLMHIDASKESKEY